MKRLIAASKRLGFYAALAAVTILCTVGVGGLTHPSTQGLAAPASPPPPPTYVPTPIGPPPGLPKQTPTATATAVPLATPTSAVATPTSGPVVTGVQFSLQAARVSKRGNPGNLRGLVSVRPGSKVWLMMYYTVKSLPRPAKRVTTYSVLHGRQLVFRVAYRGTVSSSETGKPLSRYTTYSLPQNLPFGRYTYQAVLLIGSHQQSKAWKFSVAGTQREVGSTNVSQALHPAKLAFGG